MHLTNNILKVSLSIFLVFFIIIYAIFVCSNKKDVLKTPLIWKEKKEIFSNTILLDSLNQFWMFNFGYKKDMNKLLKDSNCINYRIIIQCNNRFFYKVLNLENNEIQETVFDLIYNNKNKCNLSYLKRKTIAEGDREIITYYNKPRKYNYKDSIIYNFLNNNIDKYQAQIHLLDPNGTFRIVKINHLGNLKEYDLYGYLYENQEVKTFYNALVKRHKKDDCECLENLHWGYTK